ncbi:hypothetical protein KC316_g7218 [Hortaea werneckii]|nr:hypothetical protein KC324_g10210 [Hortaea werneckii]KAI7583537.1 hypothetical protein KC316_g7218 [Hortaea werneckii]
MDHLLFPHNPISPSPRVPYVCDEEYDGHEWRTYPIRAGWPQVLPADNLPAFAVQELRENSPDEPLAKFLQTWIFFGFLHKLLAPFGLYDADEYIGEDARGKYVHTSCFLGRLVEWQAHVNQAAPVADEKRAIYEDVKQCLEFAEATLRVLGPAPGKSNEQHHPNFNPGIKLSLATLCHTIDSAIKVALLHPEEESDTPQGWANFGWQHQRQARMIDHGWCPSEIAVLRREFHALSAQTYLQHMEKPGLGLTHGNCSSMRCENLQIIKDQYRTAHVEGCRCKAAELKDIGPDLQAIVRLLEAGTFPVLRIDGDNERNVRIEAIPYTAGTRYVALSHVWADGLGNPSAIELPPCQLLRLRELVRRTEHQSSRANDPSSSDGLYLWCDTLCCPVVEGPDPTEEEERPKKLSLAKMQDVYSNATHVLVLDRALLPYDYEAIGAVEAGLRIFTSRWWRRLWTYQEAVLAESLLIQFADRAVSLLEIRSSVRQLGALGRQGFDEISLQHWALSIGLNLLCREIRLFWHQGNDSVGPDLPFLVHAVAHRSVSVKTDEPLCMNTVLKLDQATMAAVAKENRMQTFWRAAANVRRGIPKTVVFNALERLTTPGLRWAPATVFQPIDMPPQLIVTYDESAAAQVALIPTGLQACFPAWELTMGDAYPNLPADWWALGPLSQNAIRLRSLRGEWLQMRRLPQGLAPDGVTLSDLMADRSQKLILILESDPFADAGRWQGLQTALLASISKDTANANAVRSQMIVGLERASGPESAFLKAAYDLWLELRDNIDVPPGDADARQRLEEHITTKSQQKLQAMRADFSLPVQGELHKMLAGFTINQLLGRNAQVLHEAPGDSVWCID